MKKTVSRRLMPTLRAGFTAPGDPGRAGLSAREAGTPHAARRAKRADYTGSPRTKSSAPRPRGGRRGRFDRGEGLRPDGEPADFAGERLRARAQAIEGVAQPLHGCEAG